MSDFLTDYITYNEGSEIPSIFAIWCGLAGISAALGRRTWVNMGKFEVFPNIYCVLVAGSGRNRKSTAIGIIENLLRQLDPQPNLIAQKITPEAMIDALRFVNKTEKDGKIILTPKPRAEGFVIADELVTFLNSNSYEQGLASLLLTFFDSKPMFEYKTKSGGSQKIQNVCLGLLGGTTIDLLMKAIPEDAIGAGLTSRICFVYSDERMNPVAFPTEDPAIQDLCLKALNRLQTIEGPVILEPDARDFFARTYESFYRNSPFFEDRFLAGYAARRHVHLIKIAMLIGVARTERRIIALEDIQGADRLLTKTEEMMPRIMELITSTKTGDTLSQIRGTISRAKSISRLELLRKYSHKLNSHELDLFVETLEKTGEIKVVWQAGTPTYTWNGRDG